MKVRQRIRSKQMPTTDSFDDWRFDLNEGKRVVRMTLAEATMCNRLGISIEDYAKELVAGRAK